MNPSESFHTEPSSCKSIESDKLAQLISAQLEEAACGGWSKGSWDKIKPD